MFENGDEVSKLYEDLIARFIDWAQDNEDIRAALVIGSRFGKH